MSLWGFILITSVVLNETFCSAPRPLTNELEPDDEDSNKDKLDEVVSILILIVESSKIVIKCFLGFIVKSCKFFLNEPSNFLRSSNEEILRRFYCQ